MGQLPGGVVESAIWLLHMSTGVSENVSGVAGLGTVSPTCRTCLDMEIWACGRPTAHRRRLTPWRGGRRECSGCG